MQQDWDPYEHLMDITKFCNKADEHLNRLMKNQTVIVNTMNQLREDLDALSAKIDLLEEIWEMDNGD